jgi:integrase
MERFLRPTLKLCGIRHRDARQTRHTFATICLLSGLEAPYVAKQMGNRPKMFWRVYSKWIEGKHNELQRGKFDAFVGKSGTTLSQENDDSL